MIVTLPDQRASETEELLQSLHASVRRARQKIEDLLSRVDTEEEAADPGLAKRISALETLIANCHKIEVKYVERLYHDSGIVQGGYALDLDAARAEIGGRLDRLRDTGDPGEVP